jgi:DNA-binding NarL/FixJ family response regulator
VVCGNGYMVSSGLTAKNEVAALLHRGSMTCEQLRASVHAAMTGLKVKPPDPVQEQLAPRSLHVLELIADGLTTREIADALSFSERTIKKLISGLERTLGARNRAHAAALAIRQGLIPNGGQRRATSEPPRDDPAATLPEKATRLDSGNSTHDIRPPGRRIG